METGENPLKAAQDEEKTDRLSGERRGRNGGKSGRLFRAVHNSVNNGEWNVDKPWKNRCARPRRNPHLSVEMWRASGGQAVKVR